MFVHIRNGFAAFGVTMFVAVFVGVIVGIIDSANAVPAPQVWEVIQAGKTYQVEAYAMEWMPEGRGLYFKTWPANGAADRVGDQVFIGGPIKARRVK